ncbi:MAG: hypothetical protein LDL33_14885 [Desulfomonile sp.]|nr:hypothetical protein [Desulfomonile sp.]
MRRLLLLLSPRWKRFRNRLRTPGRERLRLPFIAGLVAVLWVMIYVVFTKALAHFTAEEMFGTVAAVKLLSMIMATFGFVLIVSNIITTFSTFFLSEDLQLLMSGPVSVHALYGARFVETLAESSWMVLVFGLPVFLAYGTVFPVGVSFYLLSLVGLICLLVMTTAVGIFIVELLVRTFPVRRLRDLFVFVGLLLFAGVYLLFRMVRPEEFLNPEGFASLMDYLSVMSEPSSPLLPTSWIVEMLRPYITGYGYKDRFFYLALLAASAIVAYRLVGHHHQAVYFSGFSKAFESRGARLTRSRLISAFERVLERFLEAPTVRLVIKETLLTARDSGRLSQVLLLAALLVVYLYNFSVLPAVDSPAATHFLKNAVAFLNIGLAGFVLASLGIRFLFPAVSMEGRAFWILKGSPVRLRKVLWVKFFFYLVPMIALGLFLVIVTNRLLQLDLFMSAVSTATVVLVTVGITSLCIGMGVVHADFKDVDPNRTATSFGALVTMIYAGLAVAAVILLEAYPVYRIVTASYFGRDLGRLDYAIAACCFAGALAVVAAFIIRPLKMGLDRVTELEV